MMLRVNSWLECIIHQNFGKLNLWVQVSFIILFVMDLYKNNHARAFVNFLKYFSSKTIDWIFTNSQENSLDRGQKLLFTDTEQEGHDGPVSLHWLIREIHSYQTLHCFGIGLKHKIPYKD